MSKPKWVDGQFGKALEFDGSNFVDMGNDESLQFDGDVTIVFWAKPESVAAGRQNIVCKSYGGEGCLTMEPDGPNELLLGRLWRQLSAVCGGRKTRSRNFPRWTNGFTSLRREMSQTVSIRCTKTVRVTGQDKWLKCGAHPCGDSSPSNLNLLIGSGYAGKFRGIIDDVAIFNVVLSEDEIKSIMDEGLDVVFEVSPADKTHHYMGSDKEVTDVQKKGKNTSFLPFFISAIRLCRTRLLFLPYLLPFLSTSAVRCLPYR